MTSQQPEFSPIGQVSSPEHIASGVTREWACDRRIVVFSLHTNDRHTVDVYCETVKQTMADWPRDQIYLALYDHSDPRLSLTPYVREKIRELSPLFPELQGYIAMVVSSMFAPLGQIMMRARNRAGRSQSMFRTREQALDWLYKKLPKQT